MLHNRFFLPWAVCYRPRAFPPTFNICCLRFSAVGGSTRSLDARSWSNPKPFSASNTTPGPTARPLGVPLAALAPSDPETFQNTSHFHLVTQHNGFLEKVCYNSFLLLWRLCCVTGTPPAAVSGHLNGLGGDCLPLLAPPTRSPTSKYPRSSTCTTINLPDVPIPLVTALQC